ncbi:MAG: TOBE domain-containing protein [Bacteroidia bacterium]|nr:TOBE domain-containing protein [Bacteroidia bacterium]
MNRLKGNIHSIETKDQLSLVKVEVKESILSTIIVNRPEELDYLRKGNEVYVLFKETEVVLGLPELTGISLQNRLLCKVIDLEKGALLCRVNLNHPSGQLVSIVTRRAVEELDIQAGSQIMAFIKTNEMMLSE